PPADELALALGGPRVEHVDSRSRLRRVDPADRKPGRVGAWVTTGGDAHADRGVVRPGGRRRPRRAPRRREEPGDQIAGRAGEQHLALRVSEAAVELDDLRPLGRQYQAHVEDTAVRRAL